MLDSNATNRMACTVCDWTRIIDHMREYRGGHTPPGQPDDAPDCHGMLTFAEVEPAPAAAADFSPLPPQE